MVYRVIITPDAKKNLRTASAYIRRDSPAAAERWLTRMRAAIRTLASNPERCPMAPEAATFDEPIRELPCGSGNRGTYRVVFVIIDKIVYVLHVRHGSMLPLAPDA
jgi:plasmid stabilization system protein ParE